MRCTKGDCRQQKNAAPGSNIEDAWAASRELTESTVSTPFL
jgi:hypothetical protein